MAKLIKDGKVVANEWKTLILAEGESPEDAKIPYGNVLVPLSVWRVRKLDLIHREWDQGHQLGVWLAPTDDPATLVDDLDDFSVVAVHFPLPTDGRGFSIATLLRTRYSYDGELRAIGAVDRDYLHNMRRVGFNAFEVKEPEKALASLHVFSEAYQGSTIQRVPLFRRAVAGAAAATV